jgi:hypothetical protein
MVLNPLYIYVIPGLHRSLKGHRNHAKNLENNALSSLHFYRTFFDIYSTFLPGGLNPT